MLDEPIEHRKQMLNEMLRRGVTVNDLVTLKRGEIVYLWEKDVATMRELSDYTKKSMKQIQRICRREESILYKGKSKISTAQKTVFGKLKFPARYAIRMDEYPDFVQWRETNLNYVSMRTAYRMLGKKTLRNLIREGRIKTSTAVIKGKEVNGISKTSLLNQLDIEISVLKGYIEELTTYNDSDFDDTVGGEILPSRTMWFLDRRGGATCSTGST